MSKVKIMENEDQAVITDEAKELACAIACSAEFLCQYQQVLGTLTPSLAKQLIDWTEALRENLQDAYMSAGAIYGDNDEGLKRWFTEVTFCVAAQRLKAEINVRDSLLRQLMVTELQWLRDMQ